jgi:hypothetical protein
VGARRFALLALLLACKPPPSAGEDSAVVEPSVIVEQSGTAPVCELVEPDTVAFEVQEHDDWLDLWFDRELATPEQIAWDGLDRESARKALCSMTYDSSGGALDCTDGGRQVLSKPTDHDTSLLIVEPTEQGLRSIEISRWQHTCRCECGSWAELLADDPLSVVVFEYEDVASEVHLEGDEIVEGCEEGDECQTACIGESYGRQRLLVFDDSLGVREAFIDTNVHDSGVFDVRFAIHQGRLIALDDCMQMLTD